MSGKYLTGTYNAGYTLTGAYLDVAVDSTALIRGEGLVGGTADSFTIRNFGIVAATNGRAAGIGLEASGTITNGGTNYRSALISGGDGGRGSMTSPAGGNGGLGIVMSGGLVTNYADIRGGTGGAGISGMLGGSGGAGIAIFGGVSVDNSGAIRGGAGGVGSGYSFSRHGGAGGDGIVITSGGSVDNSGLVVGGAGGGFSFQLAEPGISGSAGAGIVIGGGGSVGNSGNISGGSGGAGIVINGTASLANSGTIAGGSDGGDAVRGDGGTIVNSGVIIGSKGSTGGIYIDNFSHPGGNGGAGISLGSAVVRNFGTVVGGAGGDVLGKGGRGAAGTGIVLTAGSVENAGTIIGGSGGSIYSVTKSGGGAPGVTLLGGGVVTNRAGALISGESGIGITSAGTIDNFGAIVGTSGTAVSFGSGAGLLILEKGSTLSGAVANFQSQDKIDLAAVPYNKSDTLSISGDDLTVSGGGISQTVTLTGTPQVTDFALRPDPGSGTVITTTAAADDYRNIYNDSTLPLGNLAEGGAAYGTIGTVGDKDVFAVNLSGESLYVFNLDGFDISSSYTLRDPYLRLLDGAGNQLAVNDDTTASNWSSQLVYYLPFGGTYYLEASSSPSDHTYTTGSYQIRNTTASALAINGTATGSIGHDGQINLHRMTLVAGTDYIFNLDGFDVSSTYTLRDPYLRLLDSNGNLLSASEDISSSNYSSQIVYTPTSSGAYYLEASPSPSDGAYTTGSYQVRAAQEDYRNSFDDTRGPLGSVAVGGTATGRIDYVGDKDVFAVTLTAGTTYTFNMDGYDTSSSYSLRDPYLRLLDSSGGEVNANDDIGTNNFGSQIVYTAASSGTYYLVAASSPSDGTYTTGNYQVRVADPPAAAAGSSAGGNLANGGSAPAVVAVSSGDEALTAGDAAEVFDFSYLGFGHDTIAGFDPMRDSIRLPTSLAGSYAAVQSDLSATPSGTLIALDKTHSIALDGLAPTALTAANFRFG